uniref:Histone deacetylase 14 n=1 Tax=Tanacetum cinerariifolium TaxID=118510 RepID=A0A6L2N2I2_TANCI|nr:histone deacetylase 14 [Tanacetum cinerariifolium]
MADVNVNAPADQAPTMAPPTRTDDQIMPHIRWVPIGKSNCYLDVEKSQSNPIYKIAVDILKHTNFFRAFTTSSTIPSIYVQQFWDTVPYDKTAKGSSVADSLGVVNRAHIDYAERIWKEFTQSIHTFIEDKKNQAHHNHGKKKATLIVIPSISAKGTKREVFGMPIPGNHITADIQDEPYYEEYLEKVAKHQRYLAGDKGSDLDSPAPKPAKATKKSKPSAPKADLRPPVIKPTSSQQPEPKPAPAKSQGKKRKVVTETSDKPSLARKSRSGLVTKRRKPSSSLRSVDVSVDEGIPEKEPRFDDEEADVQRALEEILKSVYDAPRGPLLPVVIREPESGKYQPLPEVQGKGKEKVTDEQVALDLLNLQTPKKKIPANQFIFQTRTSTPTGSSGHDESSSLYAEIGLTDSHAGPNPSDAAASQPLSSPVVHAGPNLKHMDLEAIDVSTQPHPEKMDEGFTATAYTKVHENLKLTVKEQVILEEHANSTGTLSSLQHLAKDLSFSDLFFNDKPSKADNEKTTVETEVESMVSVTIQQDTFAIPPMTTPTIDLTSRPDSPNRIGELEHIMANVIQDNKHLEERDLPEADMKEILHQRMWETNSYKNHEDHMMLYEALEKSMNRDHTKELLKDLAKARKKKKKSRDSPNTPPRSPPHQPPPSLPPAGPSRTLGSPRAFGSSQVPPPPSLPPSTNQEAQSSDDEDIENVHIPKVNLRQDWWKPLEEARPATTEPAWSIPSSDVPVPKNNWASALASTYSPLPEDSLLAQTEYLRYGSKGSRPALSISKMKAAYYPDVGLEQMVPDQIHASEGDRRAVRTHIRILSVVRIKVFSMYGYDYIKKIVLCRADLNKHIIAERDFKYLYPSEFEYLYLLNLQGHLNHLPPKDKMILTTAVNLWTRYLVIKQRVEDFQLGIESYQTQLNLTNLDKMPQALNTSMTTCDGTMHQIDEALDYRVKEFKVNRMNPGLNTRFWTRKDVDRSKEFMFAIQKRLKTRRIFCNLESFVSGRVRDGDYRLLK